MKLTTRDHIPIGQARVSALQLDEDPPKTLTEACRRAGLHPESGCQFLRRHPECRGWTFEQIVGQMLDNRDQSAVAKRQQRGAAGGDRNRFGRVKYE